MPYKQYIDGEWVDSGSGATFDIKNPATGEVVASYPYASLSSGSEPLSYARHRAVKGVGGQSDLVEQPDWRLGHLRVKDGLSEVGNCRYGNAADATRAMDAAEREFPIWKVWHLHHSTRTRHMHPTGDRSVFFSR